MVNITGDGKNWIPKEDDPRQDKAGTRARKPVKRPDLGKELQDASDLLARMEKAYGAFPDKNLHDAATSMGDVVRSIENAIVK